MIYVLVGQEQAGTYSEEEIRGLIHSGQLARNSLAWSEGMADWKPLEQVINLTPVLPPIPLRLPPVPRSHVRPVNASSTTIHTISGVLALILGLLAAFNIGGCLNAKSNLTSFQSGDNALEGVEMLRQTYQGANEGDPLRGISGLLDKSRSLNDEVEGFQVGAWLCLVGAGIAGAVFMRSKPKSLPRSL